MEDVKKQLSGIARVLRLAKTEAQLTALLGDLLTDSEIEKIHERIRIVACLKDGLSQRETQRETNAGIATVSRGARLLQGPKNMLSKIIESAQQMSWWYGLFWQT